MVVVVVSKNSPKSVKKSIKATVTFLLRKEGAVGNPVESGTPAEPEGNPVKGTGFPC